MEMDIRLLAPGEGALWKALSVEAMRLNPLAYICTAEDEATCPLEEFEADLRAGRPILVAGDSAGLLSMRIEDEAVRISSVYVRAGARGQGLGDAMIEAARVIAVDAGCGVMRLGVFGDNAPAVALYHRNGFAKVSERLFDGRPDWVMERIVLPTMPPGGK